MSKPKVSILCLSYNQEKYISQALDSFLMQETNFSFEVLINDDASTDKTTQILKTYQKKHPHIIKPIFHRQNQYSQGVRNITFNALLPLAQGKYISLCEGDDFFIDKNKLQLQVDFLDKHPNYSLCFHPGKIFFENHEEKDSIYPDPEEIIKHTVTELLKRNFMLTNTVLYRRQKQYHFPQNYVTPGDWYLHLYHAKHGKIGFINRVMSTYRRHSQGIWWNSYKNPDQFYIDHGIMHLSFYFELIKLFGYRNTYRNIVIRSIHTILKHFIKIDKKYHQDLLAQSFQKFPQEISYFYRYLDQIIDKPNPTEVDIETRELYSSIFNYQNENQAILRHISEVKQLISIHETHLNQINSSKYYKIWQSYCYAKNYLKKFIYN